MSEDDVPLHSNRALWLVLGVLIVAGAGLLLVTPDERDTRVGVRGELTIGPPLEKAAPKAKERPTHLLEPRFDEDSGRWVADLGDAHAVLTLVPVLQAALTDELRTNHVQRGGTVLLQAGTGRVLALASHEDNDDHPGDPPARIAFAPAASVAKLPAVAALLRKGVSTQKRVCYAGGHRRLQPKHLDDDPRRDRRCVELDDIVPFSVNAALAKLVDKHLPAGALAEELSKWGFNRRVPFAYPVEVSLAPVPADRFGHAKAAAGFGDVVLSPLHGAIVASIPANDGMLIPPRIVDRMEGAPAFPEAAPERAISKRTAKTLKRMMHRTVREGTGTRAFSQAGRPLRGIEVGGKTGSLTDYENDVDYTWFVGFAPVDKPEVIVAAAVENDIMLWHTRAPDVAVKALEAYFAHRDEVARLAKR